MSMTLESYDYSLNLTLTSVVFELAELTQVEVVQVDLTLTSVVFEFVKRRYKEFYIFHLTLTSVVFESRYKNITKSASYLTLTSVVFEFCR